MFFLFPVSPALLEGVCDLRSSHRSGMSPAAWGFSFSDRFLHFGWAAPEHDLPFHWPQ